MSDFGELPLDRMIPSWLVCLQVDCNHQFVPSARGHSGRVMSKPQIPTVDKAQEHWTNHRAIGGLALEINHM